MKVKKNLKGLRFGRWTVIEEAEPYRLPSSPKRKYAQWLCKCDCGTEKVIGQNSLLKGTTSSCGCYRKEWAGKNSKTHGKTKTREYIIWFSMRDRCSNPNDNSYQRYGGRGIRVCKRWENSFEAFLEDMGQRPGREFSIERIDNNGNYEPSNCKWIPSNRQAINRRTNRIKTFRGETACVRELWRKFSYEGCVGMRCYEARVRKGWSVEEALYLPKNKRRPKNKT